MNKNDLIDVVSITLNNKKAARLAVNSLLESITEALHRGDSVRLSGFGTFSTTMRKARKARNPHTGESIQVAEKRVARFTPAKALKSTVG